jgi:hypothetical protein
VLVAVSAALALLASPSAARAEDEPEPHHGRSLVEMGAGLALGSVLYVLMMDRNVADWDNPTPGERFDGRAWRLDNNSLAVNFIAHPLMGGAAYSFARANHHEPAVSFGYAFLTSFLWEFVLEFKEKVSVNDVMVTPLTGVPVGEFFYKLGLYLERSRALQWTLGTGVALDRALDERGVPLRADLWHEFELGGGVAAVHSPGSPSYVRYDLSARGTLVTLPGYLGPDSFGRFFRGAEISSFALGSELSRHGAGLSLQADTLVAGYHAQDRRQALTVGASLAYSYLRSTANVYDAFREAAELPEPALSYHVPTEAEQYAALHLPGPALDWHLRASNVALFVAARLHPDFAGLGAPAFYDWAAANPDEKGKHILHRQGYFYGWGGSGGVRAGLRLGPLRFAAEVFHGRYWSQDGLDRHVERLTADVPVEGDVLFYGGSAALKLPLLPVTLGADFGVRRFRSQVSGYERVGRISHRGFVTRLTF